MAAASPFASTARRRGAAGPAASARDAFDRTLRCSSRARAGGDRPATFLLDEVLELRTFESFPGLRHVLRELLQALAESGNRFVLTSRYVARAHRLLRDGDARFEVIHLPPLSAAEVTAHAAADGRDAASRIASSSAARSRRSPTAAPPTCARSATPPSAMSGRGGDPISALTALLTADGALTTWCGYRYELRLHRRAATARSRRSSRSSPTTSR